MKKLNLPKFNLALFFVAVTTTFSPSARAVEIAFEQDSSVPLVYLNVALKAGSVQDPEGKSGLTNFMGEMLLRGTRSKTKEQIDLALDQIGAKLAIETRADAMILRGSVLATQLDPFLALVNEILTQPSFPENEIRKLRSEVTSAILEELGSDPTLATLRFTKLLFRNHPYGKPVMGTIKDVAKLNRAEVLKQYERLVRDKFLLIVGAGDAKTGKIETWAEGLAHARPNTGHEPMEKVTRPEDAPSRRLVIIDKPDRTQTQINGGQIGVRMTDSRFFPLYLGNYAFGGGSFSARLMVEIRVKRGWSYGANSYFRHGIQPRSWQFHLFPAAKDTAPALETTLKMVEELKEKGITPEEFDFSKRSLVNSAGFMYNTSKKRVENKLLERTLDLPDGFMKSFGPELSKVQLADVNAALKDYLRPDRLTIAVLGTASDLKEPLAKAAGIRVEKVEVIPYTQE